MAQVLDFTKIKKNYLTIVLPDEGQTRLQVMTPTKKLLSELADSIPEPSDMDTPTEDELDALYTLCARLMSRNKAGIRITGDHLAECLDFEDVLAFFTAYSAFVTSIAESKN
jgi:hypothetical protein